MELCNEEQQRELLLRLFLPIFEKAAAEANDFPDFTPEAESRMVCDLRLEAEVLGIPFPEVSTYDELDAYLFPEAGNQSDHEPTTAGPDDLFDKLLATMHSRDVHFENTDERVANGFGLLQEVRAKKLLSKKR